jgi:hypothetical protein
MNMDNVNSILARMAAAEGKIDAGECYLAVTCKLPLFAIAPTKDNSDYQE